MGACLLAFGAWSAPWWTLFHERPQPGSPLPRGPPRARGPRPPDQCPLGQCWPGLGMARRVERRPYRRASHDHAILAAIDEDLDELIGFVAAEANHEPNRRRQQRLDVAFDTLNTAAQTPDSR